MSTSWRSSSGGEPGADGLSIDIAVQWQLDYKLAGTTLLLGRLRGTLDPDLAARLGRHKLVR